MTVISSAVKLSGKWPKSQFAVAREREDLDMRHHHYHCQKNSEGFACLRADNCRREEEERNLKQAEELKLSKPKTNAAT